MQRKAEEERLKWQQTRLEAIRTAKEKEKERKVIQHRRKDEEKKLKMNKQNFYPTDNRATIEENDEEDSEDDSDDELVTQILNVKPEAISLLPQPIQETVSLYRFMKESAEITGEVIEEPPRKRSSRASTTIVIPPGGSNNSSRRASKGTQTPISTTATTGTSTPVQDNRAHTSSFDEEEIRRLSETEFNPLKARPARVSVSGERELYALPVETVKLADEERRLMDELEEVDRLSRMLDMQDHLKGSRSSVSSISSNELGFDDEIAKKVAIEVETAAEEAVEASVAVVAAIEEEQRIQEELNTLEDTADLDQEEAAIAAEELAVARLEAGVRGLQNARTTVH